MFYAFIALTFVASFVVAVICFACAALAGFTQIANMNTDDLLTIFFAAASLCAAAMSFWAPRTSKLAFASRFHKARGHGRILGALLLAHGLVWMGYLLERWVCSHLVGRPSASTVTVGLTIAISLFIVDLANDRRRNAAQ